MTYAEIDQAFTANLGDADALLELWTRPNLITVTACVAKSFANEFQTLRDESATLSAYLSFRSAITAAADSAALRALFTPYSLLLAQYGREYEQVKAIYIEQLTSLAFADPATEATTLLAARAAANQTTLATQPTFDPC